MGFGYRTANSVDDLNYYSPDKVFRVTIPNQFWGLPPKGPKRIWYTYEDYKARLVENIPTQVKTSSEAKETASKVSNLRPYPSNFISFL